VRGRETGAVGTVSLRVVLEEADDVEYTNSPRELRDARAMGSGLCR
jgi:hypothetical protein